MTPERKNEIASRLKDGDLWKDLLLNEIPERLRHKILSVTGRDYDHNMFWPRYWEIQFTGGRCFVTDDFLSDETIARVCLEAP